MAEFGFNFVRLPLDYRIWTVPDGGWREPQLKQIDQALDYGQRYGIHVCLCLHRAPGYHIGNDEPPLLWEEGADGDAKRRQFLEQWRMFAARYRDVPSQGLSFNLVNEPPYRISEDFYLRLVTPL